MLTIMLDEQTKVIFERIDRTDATLAPIAAIYDSTQGFSSVIKFLFKSIIIPTSIIIGVILTTKELIFGQHFTIK